MVKFHIGKPGEKRSGAKKNRKKMRMILIIAAVIVVLGGGLTVFAAINKMNSGDSTTTLTKKTASATTLTTTVSGSGTVSNANQYSLSPSSDGTVKKLEISQGDTVTKGQVIAVISSTDAQNTLLDKESALQTAKNSLSSAKDQLDSLYVKSPIAGRVKSLIISTGDDISTIKQLSNNLCVISTAGSMYVTLGSSSTSVSDGATLYVYNTKTGKKISKGTASVTSSNGGSTIKVTIPTDLPTVGTAVTVKNSSGTVVGKGTLELTKSVAITTQSSGTMKKVYVSENEKVSKNQKLFRLDSSSVSQTIQQAEEAVSNAQEAVDNAQDAVDALTITSPIDGKVATLNVKKGSNVNANTTLCVLIDPDQMKTVITVDELDINSVKIGQTASITLDALSKTFSGKVTAIDEIGSSQNGVASYDVTVSIEDPENVKVGMTTNADITTSTKTGVITVPAQAVLNLSGTTGYVLSTSVLGGSNVTSATMKNADLNTLVKKYGIKVTIGSSTTNEYQITSGLSAGDSYVVAVTISKSKVASLSNSASSSAFGGMGNMGGNMPTGGNTNGGGGGGGNMPTGGGN